MTKTLVALAALVLLVQWPRLSGAHGSVDIVLVALPILAILALLLGLASAFARERAPWWLIAVACFGGGTLVLLSAPGFVGPPVLELSVFVAGALSLLAVNSWLSIRLGGQSGLAASLATVGSVAAFVVFVRLGLARFVSIPKARAWPSPCTSRGRLS